MPGVGIQDYGALFIKYLPGVTKTLNNTSPARQIPLGKVKWEGDRLLKKVHVKRNTGVTNTTDGGAIPPAGKQTYVDSEAYRKFIVGAVEVTDGILNTASSTQNAAISVTKSELEGLMDSIHKWENYQFTRDGTGVVALLGSTTSGATITVNDARAMWDDQTYEIRTAASPTTIVQTFTVSRTARALTNSEATVTLSATMSSGSQAQGDYITWNSGNLSAYGKAWTGLDKLIDDATGTFQSVNVTTYPRYTSPVLDNGGTARPLTPTLFRQMLAMIKQESGQDAGRDIVVLTSLWDGINVEELYEGEVRITPDTSTVGLVMPTFQTVLGRVKVMTDPDTPYGKMYFIDRNEISRAVQAELDWRKSDGGGIFERSNNFLGYFANAVEISELFMDQRNRCGKIEDLKQTIKSAY
jgi:hypothetical protein